MVAPCSAARLGGRAEAGHTANRCCCLVVIVIFVIVIVVIVIGCFELN